MALVAVGIGLRLVDGRDRPCEVGLFVLVLAPEAYLPLRRLGAEFHASEEGRTAAAKAFEIIDTPPLPGGGRTAMPELRGGRLVVDGVSVLQPGRDIAAPARLSLAVRPGEVVALTGPSGAGKSTLLAAVLGLVEPSAGQILVEEADGTAIDVRDLDGDRWRAAIAWVPQDPFLVPGSVADNIRLVAPGASDAAIAAGLAEVGLGDVSPSLILGERGAGLSSGQRRRIGVARALLRGSPLLLLDEPTAGLDEVAEAVVLAAIARAAREGAAVLLVAHRPAAAALADRAVAVAWAAVAEGAA